MPVLLRDRFFFFFNTTFFWQCCSKYTLFSVRGVIHRKLVLFALQEIRHALAAADDTDFS